MKIWKTSRTLISEMLDREEKKAVIRYLEQQWEQIDRYDDVRALDLMIAWIREQVKYAGVNGMLLGISGGIDSTLAAILLAKALPAEKSLAMYIPCGNIMEQDDIDSGKLVELLNLPLKTVDIKPIIDIVITQMGIENPDKRVIGNLMSRLRTSVMYYEANIRNYLVMGTGDMDESYIGYWTKGMVVDISPLASLHKSEIRELIKIGLSSYDKEFAIYMASKPSTPGYWPGQNAEDEIGLPYDRVQECIKIIMETCAIYDTGVFPDNISIFEGEMEKSFITEEEFLKVSKMIYQNYHKSFNSPVLYNRNKYWNICKEEEEQYG